MVYTSVPACSRSRRIRACPGRPRRPALAQQETPPATPQPAPQAAEPATPAEGTPTVLAEITVTAQKREENIQVVPISITPSTPTPSRCSRPAAPT